MKYESSLGKKCRKCTQRAKMPRSKKFANASFAASAAGSLLMENACKNGWMDGWIDGCFIMLMHDNDHCVRQSISCFAFLAQLLHLFPWPATLTMVLTFKRISKELLRFARFTIKALEVPLRLTNLMTPRHIRIRRTKRAGVIIFIIVLGESKSVSLSSFDRRPFPLMIMCE